MRAYIPRFRSKNIHGYIIILCCIIAVCSLFISPKVVYADEEPLTRGEMAQLIVDTFDLQYDESMATPFTDVPRNHPYYEAISIVYSRGIMTGVASNTFGLNYIISKGQAAAFLCRPGLPSGMPDVIPPDVDSSSTYYKYICSVLYYGIMSVNENGNFCPNENAFRSDINIDAIDALIGPTTTGIAQLDLVNGSIEITQNIKKLTVFKQGDTEIRTEGNSAIIRQSSSVATDNIITINNCEVVLTINGLNIESPKSSISLIKQAKLVLNLLGDNNLNTTGSNAGIDVSTDSILIFQGSGSVNVTGGAQAAGIGAGFNGKNGNITINGGTVIAPGGNYGAGIGAGNKGYGGDVEINGGSINVEGSTHAIGGGGMENEYGCNKIKISNNATVTVKYYGSVPYHERIDYDFLSGSAALQGNDALFTLVASGYSGLSYQWQASKTNTGWTNIEGQTTAIASIPMSSDNDGYYYRCRLINGWGNVVYTDSAQAFVLAFTKQPESIESNLGDVTALSVTSSCANVTYQWQCSYDEGETWMNVSGEVYSTLIVNATLSENETLYRCIITATNGDQLSSDAVRISVPNSSTTYTTRYYLERADGSGYDLANQVITAASTGESVTAVGKSFDHYTEDVSMGTLTGIALEDNSLVLSRYYNRNIYKLIYETNGGITLDNINVKHGAGLTITAPSKYGYKFEGWYEDEGLTTAFTETIMPTHDITIYAKWSELGEGRGIEYKLNSITIRNSSYQSISSIPVGTFYAEVSVTNLSSQTMDTLVLATYDQDGKMLGLSFLYSNPQIGQTSVLGTSIDNSDGYVTEIKAFMVPFLGGMIPLAESVQFGE